MSSTARFMMRQTIKSKIRRLEELKVKMGIPDERPLQREERKMSAEKQATGGDKTAGKTTSDGVASKNPNLDGATDTASDDDVKAEAGVFALAAHLASLTLPVSPPEHEVANYYQHLRNMRRMLKGMRKTQRGVDGRALERRRVQWDEAFERALPSLGWPAETVDKEAKKVEERQRERKLMAGAKKLGRPKPKPLPTTREIVESKLANGYTPDDLEWEKWEAQTKWQYEQGYAYRQGSDGRRVHKL